MFLRPSQADASAHTASLLSLLEAEGFNLRFLHAFSESPRPVRRLVVKWLGLGWPGEGGMATEPARRR
jgi:hypothetical protein